MERQEGKLEVAELKTVRWALGVTTKDKIKKKVRERDRENCKARRQTSGCKATLVWTREKEMTRIRESKGDGDGDAR